MKLIAWFIYLHTVANNTWISDFFDEIKDDVSFLSNQIKAFHFQMFIRNNITGMVKQINHISSSPKHKTQCEICVMIHRIDYSNNPLPGVPPILETFIFHYIKKFSVKTPFKLFFCL